jgi:uncharacterized protein
MMGMTFYQKALDWQKRYGAGKSVGNGLQTNGLLLDRRWAAFLRENQFLVGLSLDGPEHVHDHYRLQCGGQKTWSTIVDRARMLQDAGVEVNVLSVVTDYSAPHAEEIYRFLKELGLRHMQFIPCVERGDGDCAAPYTVSAEKYGEFLISLFDLWLSDVHDGLAATSIRYFDSLFHAYVGLQAPDCMLAERCGTYLVVEHNGDVFSCDFFVEPRWKLGNLLERELLDMFNSPLQSEFGGMKAARPARCSNCRWLILCYGGCTKDRLRDPADGGEMHFCRSHMMLLEHADQHLKGLATVWLSRQMSGLEGRGAEERPTSGARPGRNDPCPCGSGRKYKRCCGTDLSFVDTRT